MSYPWYADAATVVVAVAFGWFGWGQWRLHSWHKADEYRRAVRARIREEREQNDDLWMRFIRAKVRYELLKSECERYEAMLPVEPDVHSRKVPADRLSPLSEDDFALLAGERR